MLDYVFFASGANYLFLPFYMTSPLALLWDNSSLCGCRDYEKVTANIFSKQLCRKRFLEKKLFAVWNLAALFRTQQKKFRQHISVYSIIQLGYSCKKNTTV
jgi:hypothetical protein